MKKLLLGIFSFVLLISVFGYWRITKLETVIEEQITKLSTSPENKGYVESVHVSFLFGQTILNKPSFPINAEKSIQFNRIELHYSRTIIFTLLFNPKKLLSDTNDFLEFRADEPVLKTGKKSIPLAAFASIRTRGALFSALQAAQSNRLPQRALNIDVELTSIYAWQSNIGTDAREISVPFLEKLHFSVVFLGGLPVFYVSLTGTTPTFTDASAKASIIYPVNGLLTKPNTLKANLNFSGKLPFEFPIFGLENSWFTAENIDLKSSVHFEKNTLEELVFNLSSSNFVWQPPSKWPGNLAPLYFVYGSSPKSTKLDSVSIKMNVNDLAIDVQHFYLDGDVLKLNSEINATRSKANQPYTFKNPSFVDVKFKTNESAQLAQLFATMSGYANGKKIGNRTKIQLRGTSQKPEITFLN